MQIRRPADVVPARTPGSRRALIAAATASIAAAGIAIPAMAGASPAARAASAPTTNPTGCVSHYRAGTNYFPQQVHPGSRTGFSVSYHNTYKVLNVEQPYPGGKPVSYVLWQCGTPQPHLSGALAKAERIEIPVSRVDAESTTQLPDFSLLGESDDIIGTADTAYVDTPSIVARIRAHKITSFEADGTINLEQVIKGHPDLFLTQGVANKAYSTLQASGVKVVADSDYLSNTPLARADWIAFISTFVNREAKADSVYSQIAGNYNRLVKLASRVTSRPTVLEGDEYKGTWSPAGGASYVASELKAAGANYVFASNHSTGSLSVSVEKILADAAGAQYWVNCDGWTSLAQAEKSDPRYSALAAVKSDHVWTYDKDVNAQGGNDYYEEGVVRPDLALGDLIAIFHPNLLPHHHFTFYNHIPVK